MLFLTMGGQGFSCPVCCLLDILNFKHVVQLVTRSFNSSYKLGQYIDCLALFRHFSNPRCPVCRSWIISLHKVCGMIIWVPFSRRPSSIVISSQEGPVRLDFLWKVTYILGPSSLNNMFKKCQFFILGSFSTELIQSVCCGR